MFNFLIGLLILLAIGLVYYKLVHKPKHSLESKAEDGGMKNVKTRRSFGGIVGNKISDFPGTTERAKEIRRKEKAHLKAYLKGRSVYFFGKDPNEIDGKKRHRVKEVWS